MAEDKRLKAGPFAGLTQGAADLAAAAQRYAGEWGGSIGQQVTDAAKKAAQAYRREQKFQQQNMTATSGPQAQAHPMLHSMVGKARAFPLTAVGLGLAGPLELLAGLATGTHPSIRVRDNALQYINVPTDGRAYTLGNTQFYPSGSHPDSPTNSYSGPEMRLADHEGGHSDGAEQDGLGYAFKWLNGGGGVATNPIELDADRRALERAKRRLGK